jgi:hypothetical protein
MSAEKSIEKKREHELSMGRTHELALVGSSGFPAK